MADPFADMEPHDEAAFAAEMHQANERMGAEIARLRARLAAVEALCADTTSYLAGTRVPVVWVEHVRAAARGEGDRG